MHLSRQGGDHRLSSRRESIAMHCRRAVLGGVLPLVGVLAATLPAAAQQTIVIPFAEALDRGAVFETIDNPNGCVVKFLPDQAGQFSVIVETDCRQITSNSLVTVRLFSRFLLNEPWTVIDFRSDRPDVQLVRIPAPGTRNLWTEVTIPSRRGDITLAPMTVRAKSPGSVPLAVCPKPSQSYACNTTADCAGGFTCSAACSQCLPQTTEAPTPRLLTVAEIRGLGYDPLDIIWESISRNNPSRRCPTRFDDRAPILETGAAALNCTGRTRFGGWSGAQASFDLFRRISLNAPWAVASADVVPFATDSKSSSAIPLTVPAPGSRDLFTRVRMIAAPRVQMQAAVTIHIGPVLPIPLPICTRTVGDQPLLVCSSDEDCPTDPPPNNKSVCSISCGNRCMRP